MAIETPKFCIGCGCPLETPAELSAHQCSSCWLEHVFEFAHDDEHCSDCGGDIRDHTVVVVDGKFKTKCKHGSMEP